MERTIKKATDQVRIGLCVTDTSPLLSNAFNHEVKISFIFLITAQFPLTVDSQALSHSSVSTASDPSVAVYLQESLWQNYSLDFKSKAFT